MVQYGAVTLSGVMGRYNACQRGGGVNPALRLSGITDTFT